MTPPMLHPRIAEVVTALALAQQEMYTTLAQLPMDRVEATPPIGGWTLAQVIDHLAIVEDGGGRLIGKLLKAAEGTIETSQEPIAPTLERFQIWHPSQPIVAPEMVAPAARPAVADAIARQSMARSRLLTALEEASGRDLAAVTAPHPVIGPLNAYQWALVTAQHQRRHLVQLRTIATSFPR